MIRSIKSVATRSAHVVGPGKLKIHNRRLAFSNGKVSPVRLDPAALETIVCYGNVGISDDAFRTLFQKGVHVSWLTFDGSRLLGRITPSDDSLAQLRLVQYRWMTDEERRLPLACNIVHRKLESQLEAAVHYQRHGQSSMREFCASTRLRLKQLKAAGDLNVLRGMEGVNTKEWFGQFKLLLPDGWTFPGRVRRPPTDPVNSLLSLGYTWLFDRVLARIQAAGLEATMGVVHEFRHGRASLACDLMDPLRVPLVDRWVVRRIGQRSFSPDDFEFVRGKGVRLRNGCFQNALKLWQEDWQRSGREAVDEAVDEFVAQLRRGG